MVITKMAIRINTNYMENPIFCVSNKREKRMIMKGPNSFIFREKAW